MDPSFWEENGDWISAAITMVVAIAIAFVDRPLRDRARRPLRRPGRARISRAPGPGCALIRRLVFVVILLIGAAIALSQFNKLEKLATGLLASSAVLGLVLGFAARQVLANPIAGIMLAITQPIRIGDTIEIEEDTGRVDDLTLSYTFIDTGDGRLMVVPNEKVVTSVLFNRSTGDRSAPADGLGVAARRRQPGRARTRSSELELSAVDVAEITARGDPARGPRAQRPGAHRDGGEEAALRERAHEALREAGVAARGVADLPG